VTVSVDAVVYYRVSNATVSVANVENAHHSTRLLAQTTLRNVLGTKNLSEILSERDTISSSMQVSLLTGDVIPCTPAFGIGLNAQSPKSRPCCVIASTVKVKVKGKGPVLDIALLSSTMNTCSGAHYNLGSGS